MIHLKRFGIGLGCLVFISLFAWLCKRHENIALGLGVLTLCYCFGGVIEESCSQGK